MKQTKYLLIILFLASILFAADNNALPSSQISTPADRPVFSEKLVLGAKESADWQKMRIERQKAREDILSKIRESSGQEKEVLRRHLSKNRNYEARFDGDSQKKTKSRERTSFFERPEHQDVRKIREKDFPSPRPGDDCGY